MLLASLAAPAARGGGYVGLSEGEALAGWQLVDGRGPGYTVTNGVFICPADGGGRLLTEARYDDFILRFEFKVSPGGRHGIALRAPDDGDSDYAPMEIVLADDAAPQAEDRKPGERVGSLRGAVAAQGGALKPPGKWNRAEIMCQERQIRVMVNGNAVLDADLNRIRDPQVLRARPGLLRSRGRIGLVGGGSRAEFRRIRIKELPLRERSDNAPPAGFAALYDGRDLRGWQGLLAAPYDHPGKRAKLEPAERARLQAEADARMRQHWRSEYGVLIFDGKGDNLCSGRDFADFELCVDWKIHARGDSGIYLRGSPQVQIWDRVSMGQDQPKVGSGGLFNNQQHASTPLVLADNRIGEWNTFRILMVGDRVHVFLNDRLVVNDTVLENYWERDQPIYSQGPIELQNHGNTLYFKNIYVREIPSAAAP